MMKFFYMRVEFFNSKSGVRHYQDVIIECKEEDLWSAGEAMAKKAGRDAFERQLVKQRSPENIGDWYTLSVVNKGETKVGPVSHTE